MPIWYAVLAGIPHYIEQLILHKRIQHEEVIGISFGSKLPGVPVLFAYIWFVDGLLIDTGQPKARKKVLAETTNLPVEQIFVTHHHEDHSGNIPALRAQFNCKAYAPAACCELMKDPPSISLAQHMTWGDRPALHDLIPKDGKLETPNHTFELIPIPGHASDMVALYEPERKWLFSADLFINGYIGYFLFNESMAQQIESTRRILELDFGPMFCSHNPQLTDGKRQLQDKLDFLEHFFADVRKLHAKGMPDKAIFKELKLKENWFVRLSSFGALSKLNMLRSVIRDLKEGRMPI